MDESEQCGEALWCVFAAKGSKSLEAWGKHLTTQRQASIILGKFHSVIN